MFKVTKKVTEELIWLRLRAEISMCQDLCKLYDKDLKMQMMLIARMAIINMICRFKELEKVDPLHTVYGAWADKAKNYAPWCLEGMKKKLDYDVFTSWSKCPFLDSGYPWGVLTLGGLMRAYAEVSETIMEKFPDFSKKTVKRFRPEAAKGIKDGILPVELNDTFKYKKNADWEALESDLRKGWEHRAVMEEEGRWSWQRNLVQAYGYDLFKKEQVGGKKNEIDQRVVVQDKSNEKTPSKDRMRFSRWIFDDAMTEPQKKHLEKLKEFFPPWTMSGRKIWQTMLRDRISLLGDVYGLVRGATISGTTSDHAYSFFQICSSISTLSESSPEYRMLTISSDIKRQPGQWHIPSTDELTAALQNMRNEDGGDSGFGRMVRFMMLIPIIQMGIEMHHSLHEMASVIGLNDLINWSIGHYDTLYMTTKELKELEEKYLAQWNKSAKGSPGLLKSTPMKLPQNKLTNVETDIKKILQETTDKVSHGYFKTQDPFVLSKIEEENEVGACIAETREIAKHKEMALLDQDLIKKLNEAVKSGWVKGAEGEGIPTEFLNWHIRDLRYSINKNPAKMELVDNLKTALARSRKSAVTPISVDSIKEINGKIWDSYNAAWKSWQQIGKQNK